MAGSHSDPLAAVSAARKEVLRALERVSDDPAASADAADAVVSLQGAANLLGVAEGVLARPPASPAADVPPPIEDPVEDAARGEDLPWTAEALAVIALAESSVPYGSGPAGELDNWLRVLRREEEGKVGRTLRELGVSDGELTARAEPARSPAGPQAVEAVRARATELARRRRAASVTTADLLFAVFAHYQRPLVRQALYERGITEKALLEHLGRGSPVPTAASPGS